MGARRLAGLLACRHDPSRDNMDMGYGTVAARAPRPDPVGSLQPVPGRELCRRNIACVLAISTRGHNAAGQSDDIQDLDCRGASLGFWQPSVLRLSGVLPTRLGLHCADLQRAWLQVIRNRGYQLLGRLGRAVACAARPLPTWIGGMRGRGDLGAIN